MRRVMLVSVCLLIGCRLHPAPLVWPENSTLDPARFNQLALRLNLPLYWADDSNADGRPEPDEVRALEFYPSSHTSWIRDGQFTDEFANAVSRIGAEDRTPTPVDERLALVQRELDSARPALIETDLRASSATDRTFVAHMLRVADSIDRLFARQRGLDELEGLDTASASLARRNWDTVCLRFGPPCAATPSASRPPLDVLPHDLQGRAFCDALDGTEDPRVLDPYYVSRGRRGALTAVSYSDAYSDLLRPIAAELRAAATDMTDPHEGALRAYLRGVAARFESGEPPRDDAERESMSTAGSRWFVRLGANDDEVDGCRRWATFGMVLGRRVPGSATMEARVTRDASVVAGGVGALDTSSSEPSPDLTAAAVRAGGLDMVEVVFLAGSDRWPLGASDGLGGARTVAFTNFESSDGFVASLVRRRDAMLDGASSLNADQIRPARVWQIILHELGHSLTPRPADERTGDLARRADVASELCADSIGLFAVELTVQRDPVDVPAVVLYLDAIATSIARLGSPLYFPGGARRTYGQAAVLQIGLLVEAGALRWDPSLTSADGNHAGAFHVDLAALPRATAEVARRARALASAPEGPELEALISRYVDGDGLPLAELRARVEDVPSTTFVYTLRW